jgi:hypothetical protein
MFQEFRLNHSFSKQQSGTKMITYIP